jgi:PadR family transcriptional regulator PadR
MVEAVQVQLKKGVLELCVLALLSRADSYAYEIASRLAEGIDMGEGTIYPLMRRMQDWWRPIWSSPPPVPRANTIG